MQHPVINGVYRLKKKRSVWHSREDDVFCRVKDVHDGQVLYALLRGMNEEEGMFNKEVKEVTQFNRVYKYVKMYGEPLIPPKRVKDFLLDDYEL